MSKKLAIRGHSIHDKKVIELLKMMGGSNIHNLSGCNGYAYYIIDGQQNIIRSNATLDNENMQYFTLAEFLNRYPYKIGDKVLIPEYESEVRICKMQWDGFEIQYKIYRNDDEEWYTAKELLNYNDYFYDMETKVESTGFMQLGKTVAVIFNDANYEDEVELQLGDYEIEVRDGKTYAVKNKPKYPKTYTECCDILSIAPYYNLKYHTYEHGFHELTTSNELLLLQDKLNTFGKLLICLKAYWKIAGEELGLGKPWKPIWNYDDEDIFHIYNVDGTVYSDGGYPATNKILVFPTAEMRDAFYENFKELIEECKEFI